MAAGTVTVSIVDTVALRPLPYASPERLVGFTPRGRTPTASSLVSSQEYFAWLEGTQTFESLAAARRGPPVRLQIDGGTAELTATRITANLFQVLGIPPAAGRFFGPQHAQPGGPNGVILSHGLWRRMFGGDADAVGRLLRFDDGVREVVGVLPDGVWYPMTATPPSDLYIPYVATDADRANAVGGITGARDPSTLLMVSFDLAQLDAEPAASEAFYGRLLERVRRLPDVEHAGLARGGALWSFGGHTVNSQFIAWLPGAPARRSRLRSGRLCRRGSVRGGRPPSPAGTHVSARGPGSTAASGPRQPHGG